MIMIMIIVSSDTEVNQNWWLPLALGTRSGPRHVPDLESLFQKTGSSILETSSKSPQNIIGHIPIVLRKSYVIQTSCAITSTTRFLPRESASMLRKQPGL
jgi:hypothetical protein